MIRADQRENTKLNSDAIVKATNFALLGCGGVDGATRRAAGTELVHECRPFGGCKKGQPLFTRGYRFLS